MDEINLEEIINREEIQSVMELLYKFTGMVSALLDIKGNILVATGWQDICTKFHRINDKSAKNCIESDLNLSSRIKPGEVASYKCKNGLWDVVTPLYIGGKHIGNIFTGQFFYEEDVVDEDVFIKQAEEYGFDRDLYLDALHRVPRYSREYVDDLMSFLVRFFKMVSDLSYSNILLEKESAAHKQAQIKVKEDEVIIRQQLEQKEIILREVHHRIKNNFVYIETLLSLQANNMPDGEGKSALLDAIGRVESMGQLYQKMLLNESFNEVSVKDYLEDLLQAVMAIFSEVHNIKLEKHIDDFTMDVKKLFLIGIIVNELITNAMKYAFIGRQSGKIELSMHQIKGKVILEIRDNGLGLSEDYISRKTSGFGLFLIDMMVSQLEGEITLVNDKGTICTIKFNA